MTIRSLTNIDGAGHVSAAQFFGLEPERIERARRNVEWARQVVRNGGLPMTFATAVADPDADFAAKLRKAVNARLRSRSRCQHTAASAEEDFGEKLKEAVQRKLAKPSKPQPDPRYPQQRQPTKGL